MSTAPYGFCHCGCGERTPIARTTDKRCETVAGQPRRYLTGHHRRKTNSQYLVEDRGFDTPCWVWQMSTTGTQGYGQITRNGSRTVAHRWFYEREYGPVPDGLVLDHLCRVRLCVNPAHLEPVTSAENARRGDKTRLTFEDVRAIRESTESSSLIAERYGLSAGSVRNIKARRRAWNDV